MEGFTAGIIGLVVAIVVAVALFPTITSGVNSLTSGATPQLTGTSATVIGLVPLFVALAVMLVAVAFALQYLHRKGALALNVIDYIHNPISNTWEPVSNSNTYPVVK